MPNLKKVQKQIKRTIESNDFSTKILLYFSTRTVPADFDSYEANYAYTNLNPITVKGYVSTISNESLVWGKYGLSEVGAVEVLCDEKYTDWFRLTNKITINNDEYQVYKEAVGHNFVITKLPLKIVKIILVKVK